MRLTVPEPKIKLYEDGFESHDQLNRAETGAKLSDLVERIDDPLVIALDGAWGSGKSFFLKCWVGEHLKRQGNTTQTVYFDAFKHDFLDDPLIALTGAIAERFEDQEQAGQDQQAERSKKMKKAAWAVGRGVLRIGASVATFGATEALGGIGDAVAEAVGDEAKALINSSEGEKESEKFWNAHDARIAAMEAFRLALTELTEPDGDGEPQRKLVIVIDELDRCRPDYALSLLEIIKHFFNVDGVHFVLGVNLTELQNSVRARYGNEVDAAKYLQKFTSVIFPLVGPKVSQGNIGTYSLYFDRVAAECKFDENWRYAWIRDYLLMIDHHALVGLRDIEKLISQTVVSPMPPTKSESALHIYADLSILRIVRPELIQKARLNQLDYLSVSQVFKLDKRSKQPQFFQDAAAVWSACTLSPSGSTQSSPQRETRVRLGFPENRLALPAEIVANCFDAFSLTSDT